jgi:hypothetical protein
MNDTGMKEPRVSDAPMIEITDVHKWFGEFHVLRGIDLTVKIHPDPLHQPPRTTSAG